jgi:sterol desaturase/sphingolipid hydroxylase (fatty acid hydroxylase superfamily)
MEALGPTLVGVVVFLTLMAGLFVPLEYLAPASSRPLEPRGMALGAGLLVLNTVVMQLVGAPALAWLSDAIDAPTQRTMARVVVVFVASDLLGYWLHRAMHRVPWLWRFHRLHHEATALSWLDAWRQHPVDFVVHGLVVGLPGAALGASLSDFASVVLLRKAFTTFLHANLAVDFGLWLASPVFHGRHHAATKADFDTNFAGTFPLWDLLFGTVNRRYSSTSGMKVGVEAENVTAQPPASNERALVPETMRVVSPGSTVGGNSRSTSGSSSKRSSSPLARQRALT